MTTKINEINTYFGRCRCCLSFDYLKNMWEEYSWKGEKEIYGEMLGQCFAFSWDLSEDSSQHDQICETCISRLRDAYSFKKTVLESQMHLLENIDQAYVTCDKLDQTNLTEFKVDTESEETADIVYIDEREDPDDSDYAESDSEYGNPDDCEDYNPNNPEDDTDDLDEYDPDDLDGLDTDDEDKMDYEEEYLDGENNEGRAAKNSTKDALRVLNKKPKLYSDDDLIACLEAVRKDNLTLRKASELYNIPRATIATKLKFDAEEKEKKFEKKHEKLFQFMKEVKLILTYTNAIPYKSQANKYCCAYCANTPCFDDPDDLRNHTRTQHEKERTQKIDQIVPPRISEIVKFDIHDFKCIKCNTSISNWSSMFTHFKDEHSIKLDQAYTNAIPYDLTDQLKCALCKTEFAYYMHLDAHMNGHYNNYVCAECGDTFMAETRWRRHLRSHNNEKYSCRYCKKVFANYKFKSRHEELVHKQLPKFKCQYCDQRFSGEYIRHLHLLEKHEDKVEVISCEFCDKTFTWRPYYRKHKRKHTDAKRFECKECGKQYRSQIELNDHVLTHAGDTRFVCGICKKSYMSLVCLKRHLSRHH